MPIALAPEEKSLTVFPALAEESANAVGELAEGYGFEARGVEPVDDECIFAPDPFEAFARRSARRDPTHLAIAVARFFAGCWKFNVRCRKFTDGRAWRPFC
jgi:hypothetical protein